MSMRVSRSVSYTHLSLEEAKKIALKDAKLDELAQKIVFTREELSRNQGKPCYLLEFYTGTNQYFYQIDAKSGSIISVSYTHLDVYKRQARGLAALSRRGGLTSACNPEPFPVYFVYKT